MVNKWNVDNVPPQRVPKNAMKCSLGGTLHLFPYLGRTEVFSGELSAPASKQGMSGMSRPYAETAWHYWSSDWDHVNMTLWALKPIFLTAAFHLTDLSCVFTCMFWLPRETPKGKWANSPLEKERKGGRVLKCGALDLWNLVVSVSVSLESRANSQLLCSNRRSRRMYGIGCSLVPGSVPRHGAVGRLNLRGGFF